MNIFRQNIQTRQTIKLVGLMLLANLCFNTVSAQASEPKWLALDQGLTEAQENKRFVLVHFYADWCHDCHNMVKNFAESTSLQERLKAHFIPVRLSQKGKAMIHYQGKIIREDKLVRKLNPPGFPTLMFYTPQGKEIGKIPGYLSTDKLILLLDFISSEKYKKMTFSEYQNKKSRK